MYKNIFATYNLVNPPEKSMFTENVLQVTNPYEDIIRYIEPEKKTQPEIKPETQSPKTELQTQQLPVIQESIPQQSVPLQSTSQQPVALKTKGEELIDNARKFLGRPYVYGGTDPNKGADCSGFIQYMYKQYGIDIPRQSHDQGKVGQEVSIESAKPGDIIYSYSKNSPSKGHVRMVSKVENGQVYTIEAKGKKYGIVETPLKDYKSIKSIRRVINE